MFCATCFQTAEEGSKFCRTCREARQSKEDAQAWQALPAASAENGQAPVSVAVPPVTKPWSESTAWTPPSKLVPAVAVKEPAAQEEPPVIGNPFLDDSAQYESPVAAPMPPSVTNRSPVEPPDVPAYAGHHVAVGPSSEAPVPPLHQFNPPGNVVGSSVGSRGQYALLSALSVAVLVMSMFAVGMMMRDPVPASDVSSSAAEGDSAETAQRFLESAKASMKAKDFELAALQAKKGVEALEAAAAPSSEIAAAKLLLGQSRLAEGDLESAYIVCQDILAGKDLRTEAKALSAKVTKELRKQAEATLVSGRLDLRAGDTTQALQKARTAQKSLVKYGGSPEQLQRAKLLLAQAQRVDAGRGLQRPRRTAQAPATLDPGVQFVRRPRQTEVAPRRLPGQLPPPGVPVGRRQSRIENEAPAPVDPSSLPMVNAMRRRGGGTSPGQMPTMPGAPEPPAPSQPEAGAAPQAPNLPASAPRQSDEGSRRDRAGSNDVLPTYNSQGGGSAY